MCVTLAVFTDCESGTRPISTNSGSMEAGKYGLTRGTCFVVCRLELDAVAGLLWISCCVLGRADFSVFFFSICFFFFERTLPAAYMRPPCLIYLSASTGVRTGCHYLICLSVCVCVCYIGFVVFTDCESCTRSIFTNPVSMEAGEYGLTHDTCFFARRLEVVGFAGLLRLSWCVLGGVDFFVLFFFDFFFLRTHTAYCKY